MDSERDRNQVRNRHRRSLYRLFACALLLAVHAPLRAEPTATSAAPPAPCDAMHSKLKDAPTPEAKRLATIELAQCLLTRGCAEGLTAELLGDATARPAVRRTVDEAIRLLDSAAAADESGATSRPSEIDERIQLLRAFGNTFRAVASADGSEASKRALTTACVDLAIYTDDPDKQVAAAAKLWQAAAYRRAGRPERTLQMMSAVLGRSTGTAADLYGRLERCRALADAGRYVAAITLATKIEDKSGEWMIGASRDVRLAARAAARRTRADLYRQWGDALANKEQPDRASDARETAASLDDKIAAKGHEPLVLDTTIAPLPDVAAPEAPADK